MQFIYRKLGFIKKKLDNAGLSFIILWERRAEKLSPEISEENFS
jgi:hypothetical protein